MNPADMIFHHGQRVRFIGKTPFAKGAVGTVSLTGGGYATRYIVTVMWDADATGFRYGTQSVVKELLEPLPSETPPSPTPVA